MRKPCKVTLDGDAFYVNYGDLLLDGALMSGVELRHDCRSGSCGTCRLRLVGGRVFGGTEEGSDGILACQARIVSDIRLETESVPEPVSLSARVAAVDRLAHDVIGVTLKTAGAVRSLPGSILQAAVSWLSRTELQPDLSARTGAAAQSALLPYQAISGWCGIVRAGR